MELIKTEGWEGYYYEDIVKFLESKYGLVKGREFKKWMNGQTGAIHKGKLVVYKWDYEQFMKGLPDLDGGSYG